MKLISRKVFGAFLTSFAIFALIALIFILALSIGKNDTNGDPILEAAKLNLEGKSFNVLLILTDYAPDKFNDYDPIQVENALGIKVNKPNTESGLLGYRKVYAEKTLILRFDKERGNITLTPILGNTLVTVKNVTTSMETLLGDYGKDFFVEKVRAMTGLEIDSTLVFTPASAEKVIDTYFKDINYTLKCKMEYKDDERGIDINLKSGATKLDGAKAVQMLRFDDYKETKTTLAQTYSGYLKRLFKKLVNEYNYDQVCDIFENIFSYVDGEYNENEFNEHVRLFMQNEKLEINELMLSGEEQTIGEKRYFVFDEKATLKHFQKYRKIKANIIQK